MMKLIQLSLQINRQLHLQIHRVINHFASKLLQGLVDTQDVITNHAWRSD